MLHPAEIGRSLSSTHLICPSWSTGNEVNPTAPAPLTSQTAREHDKQEAQFYVSDDASYSNILGQYTVL